MPALRVLVLTNMYPPQSFGGYEESCRDVVEQWRRRGHQVTVLTSDVRVPGAAEESAEDTDVERRLRLYWHDHEMLDLGRLARLRLERHNHRALGEVLGRVRPDVVSVWAMGAMSMSLLSELARREIPTVLVVCDEWPVYGPLVDGWMRAVADRRVLGAVLGSLTGVPTAPPPLDDLGPVCFVSAFLRAAVRERSRWRFPLAPVVFSGIRADTFAPGASDRPFTWRLLYAGRIDPRKGIDTAVAALARLPHAILTIAGRGDDRYRRELELLAAELGVRGRITYEALGRDELAARYRQADVVVFPSVWEEPFGLVPVEAMACGTPVVASAVGGAAEFLVDGTNCLVVPPGDPGALASAVTRLADDAALRARVVAGGKETAGQLDVGRLADALWAWHRFVLAPPGTEAPPSRILGGRQRSAAGA